MVANLVPRPRKTGMMATAIPVAMRPYSIAVALICRPRNGIAAYIRLSFQPSGPN